MTEHRAASLADIPVNEGRMLRVGGHLVAVFHLRGGTVRATQPWCPHRRGPLADGLVGDGSLICPLHGRTFDLATGDAQRSEVGIATYPARVEDDGTIMLELPDARPLPCTTDAGWEEVAPDAGPADPPFAAQRE